MKRYRTPRIKRLFKGNFPRAPFSSFYDDQLNEENIYTGLKPSCSTPLKSSPENGELNENCNIDEIKKILSTNGETKINLVFNNKNKKVHYLLKNNRKFDLNHLKALKAKEYVAKISV